VGFATSLFRELAARGDGGPVVMGDSAGGGLALAVAQQLRDAGGTPPDRLVLLSPWLDVTCSHPDQPALARLDRMLGIPGGRVLGRWYAGARAVDDPLASPLFGDLRGLPPIQVFSGTHDVLNPDARRLRDLAARAGATCDLREYPGMFHVWVLLSIPEAKRAFAELAAFLGVPAVAR
jgi:acetyl esterase/lipase